MNTKNRVAIVTGGLSGIGKAIAERFLQDEMCVCIGARRADEPGLSAALKEQWGDKLWVSALDVADSASVEGFVARATKVFGKIDILANAAGIYREEQVAGHSDQLWDDTLNINLSGSFRMIRAVMPGMIAQKWGRIVNIASMAAHTGMAGNAAYCASKAGLLGLGRCVALEGAPHGITCNSISPTWVETEMLRSFMNSAADCDQARTSPSSTGKSSFRRA
ncbi:SDR family NAD(P)-dependent oxidoreductase [Falsigemmobacter intermedius]|uniref:SDR family oxidoreductase n=1 Tax=Falsigemmobacter intermedius TaxID=1553448 RepID=A0A444M8T5_9RHOB|nr:SDR family oxidoreductase [Falsigemmobacter intermedius]RWY38877.1 SDR family oxidoreductase [Falsigemmobacter intermedius]